jgi:hypothetical protein
MPDTKPREPETTAPNTGDGTPAPSRQQKQDAPFVWPRDLNAPASGKPAWGSDPEAVRDV